MWTKTRFQGVRYRESKDRRIKVKGHYRPDRCFYIYYKVEGKSINEKIGWESEGISAEQARDIRGSITSNIRKAEGYRSLKEKRQADREKQEKAKAGNVPFGELAQKYLDWSKEEKKSYEDDEARYRNHIAPILAKSPAREISVEDIESLKKILKKKKTNGKPYADNTIKHCITLVGGIFNYAIKRKLFIGENPVSETLKANEGFLKGESNIRTRFLSREEAQALLDEIKKVSRQTYQICCVSLYTGLRMGEIFSLTWQDIDLTNELLYVRNPKNNEARTAYLPQNLIDIFKELSGKKTGWVFPDKNGNRISQLSDTFYRAVVKLGLNDADTHRLNRVVPHTLRHTFASWLTMNGQPLLTVKELMGHKSIEMTERYAHLSPHQKREAVLKLADGANKHN